MKLGKLVKISGFITGILWFLLYFLGHKIPAMFLGSIYWIGEACYCLGQYRQEQKREDLIMAVAAFIGALGMVFLGMIYCVENL